MSKLYRDFADFLAEHFAGKVQKLSINAGFTCPNRDGTVGTGGCTYCNNQTFNPDYCSPGKSIAVQIEEGKAFFARKYPAMKYLAYFQAYTNTHGEVSRLMEMYSEALRCTDVVGLIIGTRPDCMPQVLLDELSALKRSGQFVMLEYGAESANNSTLQLINRCHTWEQTAEAVRRTAAAGIPVGLHLINGLPGETEAMIMHTVDEVNALPVDTVKFHQLQVIRGTRLAADLSSGKYSIPQYTAEEYVALCSKIVGRLRPDIAIERFVSQSPAHLLISPRWGLKNYQFTNLLINHIQQSIKENRRR